MAVVATTARKPKAGVKTKKPKTKSAATVSDVAKGYLQHLEESAASSGTLLSYEMELVSAIAELGADKSIASLTVEEVAAFFECTRVMHTRKGGDKSPLSIAKTRRVFRQALVWAVEAGLIETAPLPYDVRKE
jgi:site-specific recombinase XerC